MQLDLKQIRKQYGLSQTHVAELLGVNQTTVARWESGQMALTHQRRCELIDLFMNKRGRIDRVVEQVIKGHPHVSVFDASDRFLYTSEQLAREAKQNRSDIIGRRHEDFDDSSWRNEIYGDIPDHERLFIEFTFDLSRKDAPAGQAICRLQCKAFWLEYDDLPRMSVSIASILPATGEAPRLLKLANASDFESG